MIVAEKSVRPKVLGAKPKQAGKKEGGLGEGIFARPSDWILKFGIRIFVKKCSNFAQKTPPSYRLRLLGSAKRNCRQTTRYKLVKSVVKVYTFSRISVK